MRWALIVIVLVLLAVAGYWMGRTPSVATTTPTPVTQPVVSTAPAAPSASPISVVPKEPSKTNIVVRATWGAGRNQLGRKNDPEGSPDGPMSLTVDHQGNVYVLDEVNRRVQKYSPSGVTTIAIGGEAVQDLALGKNGAIALLDRLGEKNLQVFSADGKMLGEVALEGKHIPESGGTTGLFADRDGNLWVEREHQELVRVALPDGHSDPDRPTAPGRPSRDGQQYLTAALADRMAGTALVRALDRDGKVLWQQLVSLGAPILHLTLLDSDGLGNVYLAGHTGRESAAPPYSIVDEKLVILSLSPGGSPRGMMALPASPPATESFRELSIGDDGTIYRMVTSAAGVLVESYRL